MYETFYIISTKCKELFKSFDVVRPRPEVPFSRGYGAKTYVHFTKNFSDPDRKSLEAIPSYERIASQTIYESAFPQKTAPPLTTLNSIARAFANCNRCTLSNFRFRMVSHRGDPDAKVVFVGQSPGKNEDLAGQPFVGKSGQLLEEMLTAAKFTPSRLFTNMVACTPSDGEGTPKRTDPRIEERIACSQRLWATLNVVKPNIIIALGLIPATMFWKTTSAAKKVQRNKLFCVSDRLFIGHTFHPAYLLRQLQNGAEYEYAEGIDFYRKVTIFSDTLPRFKRNDEWGLGFTRYPFGFLEKELKC